MVSISIISRIRAFPDGLYHDSGTCNQHYRKQEQEDKESNLHGAYIQFGDSGRRRQHVTDSPRLTATHPACPAMYPKGIVNKAIQCIHLILLKSFL